MVGRLIFLYVNIMQFNVTFEAEVHSYSSDVQVPPPITRFCFQVDTRFRVLSKAIRFRLSKQSQTQLDWVRILGYPKKRTPYLNMINERFSLKRELVQCSIAIAIIPYSTILFFSVCLCIVCLVAIFLEYVGSEIGTVICG